VDGVAQDGRNDMTHGHVLLRRIPTGAAVTITYQGFFDDEPLVTFHPD
jgi:hypothetical protein